MKAEQLQVIASEVDAIESALEMAEEGDLLLIFGDDITRCWKQILNFNEENQKSSNNKNKDVSASSNVILDDDEKEFLSSLSLIKDEKGVRLAREEEND